MTELPISASHEVFAPPIAAPRSASMGLRHRLARKVVHSRLAQLQDGALRIVDHWDGRTENFGASGSDLSSHVRILDPSAYGAMAARGSVGVAEAWMDGLWTCDDLTTLVRIFVRNRDLLAALEGGVSSLAQLPLRLLHAKNSNTKGGSKKNISAHYDLGNDFFERFLDPSLTYSAGIFRSDDDSLQNAQVAKLDRLCGLLDLRPEDHLLEIGTGWGSLAMHAAERYGCRVTTTTISEEQHALAQERVKEAGLSDRVTTLLSDYRDLEGTFDKLVSCEMVEAVGAPFLGEYLQKCSSLLNPSGVMAMQAILISDQEYERALKEVDFIKRYIFPGSFIPSMTALLNAATERSDLRLARFDEIGPHYATTLRRWREQLCREAGAIRALGYEDRFLRMWEYYLCYCEGGFAERFLGVGHIAFTKPRAAADQLIA